MPVERICASVRLLDELRCGLMDRAPLFRFDGPRLVDGFADHVHDAPERLVAHRHLDGIAAVDHLLAAHQPLGRVHGNRPDHVFPEMLGHFEHQPVAAVIGLQRVQDLRQMVVELHVDDRPHDLAHTSRGFVGGSGFRCIFRHGDILAF